MPSSRAVRSAQVILQSGSTQADGLPPVTGNATLTFNGQKAARPVDPNNPYKVAPPRDMAFNNFPCSLTDPQAAGGPPQGLALPGAFRAQQLSPAQVAVPQFPDPGNSPTTSLRVEYAPIEFTSLALGLFAPPFTVIYIRSAALYGF